MGFVSSLLLICSLWTGQLRSTKAQTTTELPVMETTPLYVNSLVVDILKDAMGDRGLTYNLSLNVYKWNFTEMLTIINETDPQWLYDGLDTNLWVAFIPSIVLEALPVDVLIYRCLCDYIIEDNNNNSNNSTSTSDLQSSNVTEEISYKDLCNTECYDSADGDGSGGAGSDSADVCDVYPLAHTRYKNPIQEDAAELSDLVKETGIDMSNCGLSCDAGRLIYGLTLKEQEFIDAFKITGTVVCFLAITMLIINQIIDIRESKESFYEKPLLHHIPYIISCSLFVLTFLMTLGEIIGKERIVCNLYDIDDTFSFYNPFRGSKNGMCSTFGTIFYSALLFYILYSMLLSFVIFRQMYKPLKPLWNIRSLYFHLSITVIVIIIDSIILANSEIDGLWPMSVCLPSPSSRDVIFWSLFIPFIVSFITISIFLLLSLVLLNRTVQDQQKVVARNSKSNQKLHDLLKRMGLYCVGVLLTLGLLSITAFVFYTDYNPTRKGMINEVECEICSAWNLYCPQYEQYIDSEDSTINDCQNMKRERVNPVWFMTWTIACVVAIFGQLILSCHLNSRARVLRMQKKLISKSATSMVNLRKTVSMGSINGSSSGNKRDKSGSGGKTSGKSSRKSSGKSVSGGKAASGRNDDEGIETMDVNYNSQRLPSPQLHLVPTTSEQEMNIASLSGTATTPRPLTPL